MDWEGSGKSGHGLILGVIQAFARRKALTRQAMCVQRKIEESLRSHCPRKAVSSTYSERGSVALP
jgi:hypothetical protein